MTSWSDAHRLFQARAADSGQVYPRLYAEDHARLEQHLIALFNKGTFVEVQSLSPPQPVVEVFSVARLGDDLARHAVDLTRGYARSHRLDRCFLSLHSRGQVLEGMWAGKGMKEIAADLGISPKTVDVHRSRIMRVMQADSLPDRLRRVLCE